VATIWAPNLTLVAARATDQQLAQAIRQGVGHDGRPLWVMPSGLLSRLEDGEVAALIAWIRSLPRGGAETPRVHVGPLGRLGIALGQFERAPASLEHFRTVRAFDAGPAYAAGRRIAERVCADCHGPDLRGGHAGPDDNAPDLAIAGAYDGDQFRTLMRTGRPPNGRDLGLMRRIAVQDLSGLRDDEVAALHAYLSERAQRAPQ
jgi:mono/diheme cytochrome c family protein